MKLKSIIIVLAAVVLSGCVKNEFKITGNLEGAGTQNLRLLYYYSDENQGYVAEDVVPVVKDKFEYTGVCSNPSVVWVFRPDRTLLNVLYVERGDELEINGIVNQPYGWTVGGNDLQESLSAWQHENENLLMSGDAQTTSKAVVKYVEAHPEDKLSALLLLTYYANNDNGVSLKKLWEGLSEKVRDENLLNAVSGQRQHIANVVEKEKVRPMQFCSVGDSMTVVNPLKSSVSVLYFWREPKGLHPEYMKLLKQLAEKYADNKKFKIADINFSMDTAQWHYDIEKDSIDKWERMWAAGGEVNKSIYQLHLPYTPCFVVVDSIGNQIYRGADTVQILKTIEEALNHKKK